MRRICVLTTLLVPVTAVADLRPMVVWARGNASSARYSEWSGTTWQSASSTGSVGGSPPWVVLKANPRRDELTLADMNDSSEVFLLTWSGSTWNARTGICPGTGAINDRGFDIAYSQSSGQLLAAYWRDSAKTVGYRVVVSGVIGSEQTRSMPTLGRVRYVKLVPRPGSNDIIGLFLNDSGALYASIFDGSTFGSVTTIETNARTDAIESMDLVFESESEVGLLVYAEKDQPALRWRTLTNAVWSAESAGPNAGSPPGCVRLAAEHDSDRVILLTLDTAKDINACIWNGSAWGTPVEFETDVGHGDIRVMDVACPVGGGALVAFLQKDQSAIRYRTLSGTSWSAEQTGPNLGDAILFVQAHRSTMTGEAWVVASDAGSDLSVLRWNGSTLALSSTLETSLGGDPKTESFMLAVPGPGASRRLTQWRHTAPP